MCWRNRTNTVAFLLLRAAAAPPESLWTSFLRRQFGYELPAASILTLCDIMESQSMIFPSELVSHIFSFLSPRDIIQMRVVSKQFHEISYKHSLWITLYTNSRIPRPPGPFRSQSVQFLQHALVRSERLAATWTTQPIEAISSIPIQLHAFQPSIIAHGKWLISCESDCKLVAHDLDADTTSLLWESPSTIKLWEACPAVSTGGLLLHVACMTHGSVQKWQFLQFQVDGDSFHHALTLDIPGSDSAFKGSLSLEGGPSPFSHNVGPELFFDGETQSFYKCPPRQSELVPPERFDDVLDEKIFLTKTHIISLSLHRTVFPMPHLALFQAFVVPTDTPRHTNGTGLLRLTHEGLVRVYLQDLDLIRNSVIDPATGSTQIRLVHEYHHASSVRFSSIDLFLPKHAPDDAVLPMTISEQDIFTVHGLPRGMHTPERYLEASDHGHARGMCHEAFDETPVDSHFLRYTIDASGEQCVGVAGPVSLPRWERAENLTWSPDPDTPHDLMRGMVMCYDNTGVDDGEEQQQSVLVEIK